MGVMGDFFNIKSKDKIKGTKLSWWTMKDGSHKLALRGKVVEENLNNISLNAFSARDIDSEDVFYVETSDGIIKLYDKTGMVLVDDLNRPTENLVEVEQLGDSFVVDAGIGKWIVNPTAKCVSELYSEIYDEQDGRRKVSRFIEDSNDYCYSYYIDDKANRVSPVFLSERDCGEYKILRMINSYGQSKDIICDKDYQVVSGDLNKVSFDTGYFFEQNSDGLKSLINVNGNKMSKPLTNYYIFGNGNILIEEEGSKKAKLLDRGFETVALIKDPIVDAEAGIVAGSLGGKSVMFGYDYENIYFVNEPVARLIVDKLQGKKLASQYVSMILENEIDMSETMEAYESIVQENLEQDPTNEKLKELNVNARAKFVQALEKVSTERVRRANVKIKEVEARNLKLMEEKSKAEKRKGVASKFNTKLSNSSEEEIIKD